MIKKLTCIECPRSCALNVDIENCQIIKVEGSKCPKGEEYAKNEIENPLRILTGTVLAQDLALKMIPIRTDKPIPKIKILEAAAEIKKIKINKPVHAGDIIAPNFLGLGINLIATRDAKEINNE